MARPREVRNMAPEMVFALVLTGTIAWIMIPFVPALIELILSLIHI